MIALRRILALLLAGTALGGCPGNFDLDHQTFTCRAPADCVAGYVCDRVTYTCVRADAGRPSTGLLDGSIDAPDGAAKTSTSAGSDAGASPPADAGEVFTGTIALGLRCGRDSACESGQCVDGVCCETSCKDQCHNCSDTPGKCTLSKDGSDPRTECSAETYDCALYTWGIQGNTCYANAAVQVSSGTCSGDGRCRPVGCRQHGMGAALVRCVSAQCVRQGACPRYAPVSVYTSTASLCGSGPQSTCTQANRQAGCCSAAGDCCPAPMCTAVPGVCE